MDTNGNPECGYRDLLDEIRRLRRERDELAVELADSLRMIQRLGAELNDERTARRFLADGLAKATFEPRAQPEPPRRVECIPTFWNAGETCPACGSVRTFTPVPGPSTGRQCLDCGCAWDPTVAAFACPCGEPASVKVPGLRGEPEILCPACATATAPPEAYGEKSAC